MLKQGQYISDLTAFSPDRIKTDWQPGSKILLTANTGSGKTFLVTNQVYRICEENGWSMLVLSNRDFLKRQIQSHYQEIFKAKATIMNYQAFTQLIKYDAFNHEKYQIIVADECHFFFSDATFNNESDIALKYLADTASTVLFMSATSELVYNYLEDKLNFTYKIIRPYQFNKIYYWNDINVVKKMLLSLPPGEKAIYFCRSAERAYTLHREFPKQSAFICSQHNEKFKDKTDAKVRDQIQKNERFKPQILFCTAALDNGVNLHDPALKHIVIDMYDPNRPEHKKSVDVL